MKVKLEISIINQENPKVNYSVVYNNRICYITEINEEVLVTIKDYLDGEEFILDIDLVKSSHCIFIGKTDRTTKLFVHGDIPKIINFINSYDDYKSYIEAIINNNKEIFINANVKKIYTKPKFSDTVEIVNINLIDSKNLINKSDRIFEIVDSYKSKSNKDIYKLKNEKVLLTAIRPQFKIINRSDYKELFTVV